MEQTSAPYLTLVTVARRRATTNSPMQTRLASWNRQIFYVRPNSRSRASECKRICNIRFLAQVSVREGRMKIRSWAEACFRMAVLGIRPAMVSIKAAFG